MFVKLFTLLDKERNFGKKLEDDLNELSNEFHLEDIRYNVKINDEGICEYSALVFFSEKHRTEYGYKMVTAFNPDEFNELLENYLCGKEEFSTNRFFSPSFIKFSSDRNSSGKQVYSSLITILRE